MTEIRLDKDMRDLGSRNPIKVNPARDRLNALFNQHRGGGQLRIIHSGVLYLIPIGPEVAIAGDGLVTPNPAGPGFVVLKPSQIKTLIPAAPGES
jgi:hypothetical protein